MSPAPTPEPTPGAAPEAAVTGRRTVHREDLLAAVAGYIVEVGLHRFTLRQAAAAAGVTHKMLLYHFGSTEALVAAALGVIRDRTRDAGRDLIEADPDATLAHRLDGLWEEWIRPEVPSVLFESLGLAIAEPEAYGEAGVAATRTYLEALTTGFADYADEFDTDPEIFATLLLAVLRGLSMDRRLSDEPGRADTAFASFRAAVSDSD